MVKPHVICHMMSTVNGKIISDNWGSKDLTKSYTDIYERCHQSFASQAWMVGRVTMERHFSEEKKPSLLKPNALIERKPFIGNKEATSFAIAVDAKGKLIWDSNETGGDHIIEVLTEQVSDVYLNFLQQKKVSYIFAGKTEMDFKLALKQLGDLFNIKTLMLEGGGHINGSLLNEGLIDELSILIVPVADASPDAPTTFELGEYQQKNISQHLHLKEVRQLENAVLWLKYTVNN
ncbi:RibD family protein [Sporocytophaga myxococcoides]|uniref:RibD family protein n=1 Tax=Sporocytophaga myxococcoides TaxID=153721 RepID=UPI00048BC0D7|nr:RibD family protein [Sporocytophaga myxococcoides]